MANDGLLKMRIHGRDTRRSIPKAERQIAIEPEIEEVCKANGI